MGDGTITEYVRAEKHLCDACRPDGWIILSMAASFYGLDEEASVNLRASDATRLGEALIAIAQELADRDADADKAAASEGTRKRRQT